MIEIHLEIVFILVAQYIAGVLAHEARLRLINQGRRFTGNAILLLSATPIPAALLAFTVMKG